MCIEFDDPITKGKSYVCVDAENTDMVYPLENFYTKLAGYFFISNVGFNNEFFFSLKKVPKTSTDEIYLWENNYILDEKVLFYEKIRKIMTSNYLENISDSIYDEVFVNGKNSSEQYFFVNGKLYNYSIYPIVF